MVNFCGCITASTYSTVPHHGTVYFSSLSQHFSSFTCTQQLRPVLILLDKSTAINWPISRYNYNLATNMFSTISCQHQCFQHYIYLSTSFLMLHASLSVVHKHVSILPCFYHQQMDPFILGSIYMYMWPERYSTVDHRKDEEMCCQVLASTLLPKSLVGYYNHYKILAIGSVFHV